MENQLLNNRYRLIELIGSGGMAIVYKGVDTLLHRPVAIKILREAYVDDPTFLARFQQEAQSAARLDHPNVVTVYDVGQDDDQHYIVMEFVEGEDLKSLIRRHGQIHVDRAVYIAAQIAAGVGHAHKAGIIHCDVKPQNVLINTEGIAKVTDFGIARALSESGLTDSEVVWGSPLYFSPEQAAGERPTPASDVYSIGVLLYEMLTGVPPFQAEKPTALALMHIRDEPPPIATLNTRVPPQLEWIVRKLMAKEPSARYRTAGQVAMVLQEYQSRGDEATGLYQVPESAYLPIASPPQPAAPSQPAPVRSAPAAGPDWRSWILAVIAVIAVVGLVPLWAGVYLAWSRAEPQIPPPPMATATPTVAMVTVPDVQGRLWTEVQDDLQSVGLRFRLDEQLNTEAAEGTIIRQEPAPGELLTIGSEIVLYIAGPPTAVEMPGVTDVPIEMARNWLQQVNLQVVELTVWHAQPQGTVVDQTPSRGTTLRAGDTVTVTVSGGTTTPIPIDANLGNLILLEQVELLQARFRPGDILSVSLRWQAQQNMSANYVVFIHVIGPGGGILAQQDVEPLMGTQPTSSWSPGISLWDMHQLELPGTAAAGIYQLRVGMYPAGHPASRLPVIDAGQTTAESNSILIAEIEIVR